MSRITGKIAVVTGGSRGIGASIARRLARDGAIVILTYTRKEQEAALVAQEIERRGGEAEPVRADMRDPAAIRALFEEVVANYGRLDMLVNNAGVAEFRPLDQIDLDHYSHIFDVNVRGPLFAMQEAAKRMADNGRIVNISSGVVRSAPPGSAVYAASKAALETMTLALAAELGARGITVNAVSPGLTQTDMLEQNVPDERLTAMIAMTALGRLGAPEDIADVVSFLVSDDARWVTGQVIGANGGLRG